MIAKAKKEPIKRTSSSVQLEPSQELFLEFDEFLVQVKSTLDHLVKVPMVFLGKNRWSLNTFGDKGDSVIKALSHNLPSSQKKFSSQLISTVKKHQGAQHFTGVPTVAAAAVVTTITFCGHILTPTAIPWFAVLYFISAAAMVSDLRIKKI